jgi:L-2,4-diaminobutyric acid acetyltransferase
LCWVWNVACIWSTYQNLKGIFLTLNKLPFSFQKPSRYDGADIWNLVNKAGTLDVNSSYAYFVMADHFTDTCLVAKSGDQIKGFVTGYRLPNNQQTLFVWQIGVDADCRGMGVAKQLLVGLTQKNKDCQAVYTTISPGNKASEALFRSFARDFGYRIQTEEYLKSTDFPNTTHDDEILYKLEKKQ